MSVVRVLRLIVSRATALGRFFGWLNSARAQCMRWVLIVTGVTLLMGSVSVGAREIWDRNWIEVRTENFIVVSAIGQRSTVALAQRLESFRTLVMLLSSPERVDRMPIEVYLFHRPVPEIALTRDLGGYYLPAAPSDIIVLRRGGNIAEWIRHEYVHSLIRDRDTRAYPSWFDEGIAGMLSTMELEESSFSVGKPPRYALRRLSDLPWLDFSKILALRDPRELNGAQRSMFYYQSWLLLHYLNWGRTDRDFGRDANEYLRRLGAGEAFDVAFTDSFALDIASVKPTLLEYRRKVPYLHGELENRYQAPEFTLRQMRPDEVATGIGEIFLGRGELANARQYFEGALTLSRSNTSAKIGIAEVLGREGAHEEALEWWRAAAEQGQGLAQLNLSLVYRNGVGVERDYHEAYAWARAAAVQGVDEAREHQQHILGQIADLEAASELAQEYVEKYVPR